MTNRFFESIHLKGFLSFTPDSESITLEPLNVLVGPNGSGKSNLIEAFELLRATPNDLAQAIRDGGGPSQWIWKGDKEAKSAQVDTVIGSAPTNRPLRYKLAFAESANRIEVTDEVIEDAIPASPGAPNELFYYRLQNGRASINFGGRSIREIPRESLVPDQSVLSQRKDPDTYPELTWLAQSFAQISTMREWTFGRYTDLRKPQLASLPNDRPLPNCANLANVINKIEHVHGREFERILQRYLPRFSRITTLTEGGTVQFFIHEKNLAKPIPAERISDGTLRFIAIIAALLVEHPPTLLCIEEPELGQHPFAVALIADLLKEASKRMQIIVTTHSDALVSALGDEPQSLMVCENNGFGTEIQRIDPDKMKDWLDRYSLGDLWRSGEIGGNP